MSKMCCQCGESLSNSIVPNDIEWNIYKKKDFEHWMGNDYFEYTEEHEDFDYFWLCPKCKRAYVWLNRNKKYEETRIYEYKNIKDIDIDLMGMEELFLISSNDEENFGDGIIVNDLMKLYPHNHRYYIANDEKVLYLFNVKDNKIDGKYIMTFLSTNQYDFISRKNSIELVKTYDGIEKYFNEEGNEIKK